MILLEYHNKIIEDTLIDKFNNPPGQEGKWESFNALIADFDGVTFQMATDATNKNLFKVSISMKCFSELQKHGVEAVLKEKYGSMIVTPESGFDATVQVDLASPPSDVAQLARSVALLKRHCLAAPFYKVFNDI